MVDVMPAIRKRLRTLYPADRYDIFTEAVEQNFQPPCFVIRLLRTKTRPFPNYRTEIVQQFDVRYYPSDVRPREQCREVGMQATPLLRCLPGLRGKDISQEIVDDVLHIFVTYRQFARNAPKLPVMGVLQMETEV